MRRLFGLLAFVVLAATGVAAQTNTFDEPIVLGYFLNEPQTYVYEFEMKREETTLVKREIALAVTPGDFRRAKVEFGNLSNPQRRIVMYSAQIIPSGKLSNQSRRGFEFYLPRLPAEPVTRHASWTSNITVNEFSSEAIQVRYTFDGVETRDGHKVVVLKVSMKSEGSLISAKGEYALDYNYGFPVSIDLDMNVEVGSEVVKQSFSLHRVSVTQYQE